MGKKHENAEYALLRAKPATGHLVYGLNEQKDRALIGIEKADKSLASFSLKLQDFEVLVGRMRSAYAGLVALLNNADPTSKPVEINEVAGGSVALGPDGKSIILLLDGKDLRQGIYIGLEFAEFLRDHLDKTLQASRSETSGMKGSA